MKFKENNIFLDELSVQISHFVSSKPKAFNKSKSGNSSCVAPFLKTGKYCSFLWVSGIKADVFLTNHSAIVSKLCLKKMITRRTLHAVLDFFPRKV